MIEEKTKEWEGIVTTELFETQWPLFFFAFPLWLQRVINLFWKEQGRLIEKKVQHNLVCNVTKNGFAGILNGESGFTGIINYGAVGTGTNSPASSDTTLQTEIARTIVEAGSNFRASNVTTMSFYFDPTVGNGNIKEFGAFIDGTATVDTGFLFDRVNLDVTKTSLNSLRVTLQVTVS